MTAPFIRSPYNYDLQEASDATAIGPGGPSLTVQSMSEDADLNIMLKRFKVTGQMPETVRLPQYGDFSGITDFQSALNAVIEAEDNFLELPAELRARFQNNPQLLLDFVENPGNIAEVKKLFGEENVVRSGGEPVKEAAAVSSASGEGVAGSGKVVGDTK